jgi:ring-1,2-phenylacetyl-CoA epoxidase subunit PaaD
MTTSLDPRSVAETVTDPELPLLTLSDLGVLGDVQVQGDGTVVVELTPTYAGCPAMAVMRDDLVHALGAAGYPDVDVRTVPTPAWSTDRITPCGRRKLAEAGIAPPGETGGEVACPLCGSATTELLSAVASTPCKALRRCRSCDEPFEHLTTV